MAQEFTAFANNFMLTALDTATIYVSAHDGAPGLTGANEVTGGTYVRILCGYDAAAASSMALTATETISIPASTTVTWLGIWDAESAGNFLGQVDIGDEAFSTAGTLDVTALTLALTEYPA